MNASEMRNIEPWLDRMTSVSEMRDAYGAILRRAERQRAEAMVASLRSLWKGLVSFVETVRRTAESCTAARLHHSHG
jgi:hypothetical protein